MTDRSNELRSNDHRPANSMLVTVLCRRFRSMSPNGARFSWGKSSARNPSKLSAVTQPCAASSPSACSTRDGNKPVRRTISAKKSAPVFASVCQNQFRIRRKFGLGGRGGKFQPVRQVLAREKARSDLTAAARTRAPFDFAAASAVPSRRAL